MKRKHRNRDESKSLSLSSDKVMQESKKPCEVCGDIGKERLMTICFKCRDTRQHTYCARVLLPCVPPTWICEVCRSSSLVLVISNDAENRMDLGTSVADCSSDPKKSNNETPKSRRNVVKFSLSLLQASISRSDFQTTANVSSVIHPNLQPHTSLVAKEPSSIHNDTSKDKEQHQVSLVFPKKPRKFRLKSRHLSQPRQSLISTRDQS